ncbi:hypothetical protein GQX74_010707 [Glossina fuscipes]|nr:hypothetical protein GQX74_010707 [Glossina fuscipes]
MAVYYLRRTLGAYALRYIQGKNLQEICAADLSCEVGCPDKQLRTFLQNYTIDGIKNMNSKHKNMKLNSALQDFMYSMLKVANSKAARISLDVMVEPHKTVITKFINAEAIYQSLENNMLGFQVIVGKKKKATGAPIRPDRKLPLTTQNMQREYRTCLSSAKLLPQSYAKAHQTVDRNL